MTIVSSIGQRIAALDAMLARLNSGFFKLFAAGSPSALLATLTFGSTAFAGAANVSGTVQAASNGITASGTPTVGTIALGEFQTSGGAFEYTFTIGTSGADMNVGSVTIPSGTTSVTCSGITASLALGT